MAATYLSPSNLTGENVESFTDRVDYVSTIGALTEEYAMDIKAFDSSEISNQYWLDTRYCVTKTKRYNRKNLYSIFGAYSNMTEDEIKHKVVMEINEHADWYDTASSVSLTMKGITFKKWLNQLVKPRTMPDEVILYALCVIFRRNALVFTGIRPWTTLKKTPNMTLSIVSEMCETVLLYLGNNLYGELHRRPFSINIAPKLKLHEVQATRPIFRDNKAHVMWVVVLRTTEFETSIRPDEITEIDIQPDLDDLNKTLFSDSYAAAIKIEPSESGIKIGHLTISPSNVTKEVKQELIDSTPREILERHSTTCEVSKLVLKSQHKPDETYNLEADNDTPDTSDSEKTIILETATQVVVTTGLQTEPQPDLSLSVVTAVTSAGTVINPPLPVITKSLALTAADLTSASLVVTPNILASTSDSTLAVPVVTSASTTPSIPEALPVVTGTSSALSVVTTALTSVSPLSTTPAALSMPNTALPVATGVISALPVVTAIPTNVPPSNTTSAAAPKPSAEPEAPKAVSTLAATTVTSVPSGISSLMLPPVTTHSLSPLTSTLTDVLHGVAGLSPTVCPEMNTNISTKVDNPLLGNINVHKYYDMVNIHDNELIHLHHSDIMSRVCEVKLTRISSPTITEGQTETVEESSSESTTDQDIAKRPKKKTTRPLRKPSAARIASQKHIDLMKKGIVPKKSNITTYPVISKSTKSLRVKASDTSDSVRTVPVVTERNVTTDIDKPTHRKGKGKATFHFRTIGLKNHQESVAEIRGKKKKGRTFKCITCGDKHWSIKDLNAHYRKSHETYMCEVCSRDFSSPLSMKKHMYTHRIQQYNCTRCEKSFPFKSQLDSHMDVHTATSRLYCTEPKCSSSFWRHSDLKSHQETHKTPEVQCHYCNYSSPDKRNVKQHECKHTGEKPYKCAQCLETFMYAQQKKRHKCQTE